MSNFLTNAESKCAEYEAQIISTANKSTHIANNPNKYRVRQYLLDEVFGENDSKCDYLVLNDDIKKKYAYFIELKTESNIKKAPEQIDTTIELLKEELNGYSYRLRIVANFKRIPRITPYYILEWKEKHSNAKYAADGKYIENI